MEIEELIQLMRTKSIADVRKRLELYKEQRPYIYTAICEFYDGIKTQPSHETKIQKPKQNS